MVVGQTLLAAAGIIGLIPVPKTPSSPTVDFIVLFTGYFVIILVFQITTSSLSKALESSRAKEREIQILSEGLDKRLQEGNAELNRRSAQLESAALVARAAAEIRDLKELLENVVQQITERFNFYHAGIFLADVNTQFVVLQAASSEGGKKMIERGHRLEIGRQGIVGFAAYQKRPRIAQDVGADAVFFNNPDLPETHSEVALPLIAQNQLIGILDIQSQERNAFTDEDIHTLQTIADQIALAIENTRLIDQSRSAIQELQSLTSENTLVLWKERLGQKSVGFAYSSLGVLPLSASQPGNKENSDHVIKFPIALRGQQIGVLSLKRKSGDSAWTEGEQEMASKIASQVALAIENARLLEDSQLRASRERTIGEVSTRITSSINIENILRTTVQELGRMVPDSEVVVQLQEESN
jgi:GAF domain-containing protein